MRLEANYVERSEDFARLGAMDVERFEQNWMDMNL